MKSDEKYLYIHKIHWDVLNYPKINVFSIKHEKILGPDYWSGVVSMLQKSRLVLGKLFEKCIAMVSLLWQQQYIVSQVPITAHGRPDAYGCSLGR